jgi:hypothetical protein
MTGVDKEPHSRTWVKVNAPVDEGVSGIVAALSAVPSLETIESCERSTSEPVWCCFRFGAYWEHPWRDLAEFVLGELGPALSRDVGDGANVRVQVTGGGLVMGELSVLPGETKAAERCLRRLARIIRDRN